MDLILPFKTGDFAEAKSFINGYKGAWFRCKINGMRVSELGRLEYYLEYIDYTEDDNGWTEVFQKNKHNPANKSTEIMLRPRFPQLYWGDHVPEHSSKSDVISVCHTRWKVGDRIEWLCKDCYWTGKITRLLGEDKVKVELLKPPMGEGECYDANCKDLRPALYWSLVNGWTVPLSQANGKCWYAARLIHHKSDTEKSSEDEDSTSDEEEVRKPLKRASNVLPETLGPANLKPSSDRNGVPKLNNQKDTVVTSVNKLRPRSRYRSFDTSHATQAAVVSNQPGIRSSSKQLSSLTDRVPAQSSDIVKETMVEQRGLSDGAQRYSFRSRKSKIYGDKMRA